jgi:hypothetical protein
MKKTTRKKPSEDASGPTQLLRGLFKSFARLAERAAEDRPLLRGLRIAHDPAAHRFVAAHAGSYVEFVLADPGGGEPPRGEVECRRMDSSGATQAATIARFQFDTAGIITESTVPELAGQRIDQAPAAWSVVAAVLWINLHA